MRTTSPVLNRPASNPKSEPHLSRAFAPAAPLRGEPQVNGEAAAAEERARHPLNIVILGLSITSSWGNGHATTYRGLTRELSARGHEILFLERDMPCYAANRDQQKPPFGRIALYSSLKQLKDRFSLAVRRADVVIVGSCVPEGAAIGGWVTHTAQGVKAFYDIDTPVTIANLVRGNLDYLSSDLIPRYDLYLSFTGGGILEYLEDRHGSPMARPLYCSVDPTLYYPENRPKKWDLGYMGSYSEDRQPALDELLLQVARDYSRGRFVVAGPLYPRSIVWPKNLTRYTHLSPAKHRAFYNRQKFTLNITRANMIAAGYSPSVRLFEAAACGTPILSDFWEGLDNFFEPHQEIIITSSSEESLYYLLETSEAERHLIAKRARARVLASHTARHRAREFEGYVNEVLKPTLDTAAAPRAHCAMPVSV